MADITLDAANDAAAAAVSDVNMHTENLFNPATPDNTFAVLNGNLNVANTAAANTVRRTEVRPGQLSDGGMVGATANVDYFQELFDIDSSVELDDSAQEQDSYYVPIIGAGATFRLNYTPSLLIFTWMIEFATDARFDVGYREGANVALFYDGVKQEHTRRGTYGVMYPTSRYAGGGLAVHAYRIQARTKDRRFSGVHVVTTTVSAGWHDAGLRIAHNARQARIRVRNFKWIAIG